MKNRPYIPAPIPTDNIELPKDILLLSERIAENVHETWAAARISEGWTWGAERNDALGTTPASSPTASCRNQRRNMTGKQPWKPSGSF